MHKNAMKCKETLSKWCKNKHEASKIIDTFETYQLPEQILVTYFKFNPLGLEFGKPVKPILFPHLGLTKNESQWFSGYPARPPGFFFAS
jgi:hypothetical protein